MGDCGFGTYDGWGEGEVGISWMNGMVLVLWSCSPRDFTIVLSSPSSPMSGYYTTDNEHDRHLLLTTNMARSNYE